MTVVTLRARQDGVGVSAEALAPEALASREEREIAGTALRAGKQTLELGELFDIRREVRDSANGLPELRIESGGLRLDGVGMGMRAGRLRVDGDVGDRAGIGMAGGELHVTGNCGDWAGAGMSGGVLRVEGDAGRRAGGALTGEPRGMTGGVLLVHGDAGDEVGAAMRRGVIAVGRNAGRRAGFHAIAGTVLVFGDVGAAPALATKRGSLVVYGRADLLPSFRHACDYEPDFLRLYLRHLTGPLAFPVPRRCLAGRYRRYAGDFAQLGKGEVLLWQAA